MTAWANVELAVEAMQRGARDFIQKPWDNERLVSIVRTQDRILSRFANGERLEAENRLHAEGRSRIHRDGTHHEPCPGDHHPDRALRCEHYDHWVITEPVKK